MEGGKQMAGVTQVDRALFEKTMDLTAMALRGAMGGEKSQSPHYAAEVFRELWTAVKEAAEQDLPQKPRAGF
jgi:hypothetical protein